MKLRHKVTIILLMILPCYSFSQDNAKHKQVKEEYALALNSKSAALALYEQLTEDQSKDPVLIAYEGGTNAILCKHLKNPVKRLKHAKQANLLINEAVELAPENIDVRFMRFAFGFKTPGVLGYSKYVEEDKAFVINSALNDDIPKETIRSIYSFLSQEGCCDKQILSSIKGRL